jgi:DNA-binding transcriptional LysR family regulator
LISDVANSGIDVAFVAENHPGRDDKSLSVWSERVVVALPEDHPLELHEGWWSRTLSISERRYLLR